MITRRLQRSFYILDDDEAVGCEQDNRRKELVQTHSRKVTRHDSAECIGRVNCLPSMPLRREVA